MPDFYVPSDETRQYLEGLFSGIYMEIDEDDIVVLFIKLEASLLNSIISGCELEFVIRNPNINPRYSTLYIYDTPNNPFFATWHSFGKEHNTIKGFDEIVVKLALNSKVIRIVLLNELTHPIYSTLLNLNSDPISFHNWLFQVFNNPEYKGLKEDREGNYFPESELTGFTLKIFNKDHSQEEKLLINAPEYEEEWRQISGNEHGAFNIDDYRDNGKHGKLQEISIANNFGRYFKSDIDFFVSPKSLDGTEFADFIFLNSNGILLIESKYVISNKPSKRHNSITKAIHQLNNAKNKILTRTFSLENKFLESKLLKVNVVVPICLLNDKIVLESLISPTFAKQFSKENLPLFVSVTKFFELITALYFKNIDFVSSNLMYNLIKIYREFLDGNDTFYELRHFSVEGLSADELNSLRQQNIDSIK